MKSCALASKNCRKRGYAMAIVASMCSCGVKVGTSIPSGSLAYIAKKA